MDLAAIKQHWENWAKEYQSDLRATTKTPTIKELEIQALYRAFKKTPFFQQSGVEVLEVGCGNGHNCFRLAEAIPNFNFTGIDFVAGMISPAQKIKESHEKYQKMNFYLGNILELEKNSNLQEHYSIVFTDRCLINLNTPQLQEKALDQMYLKTMWNGYIVLIENVSETYSNQNKLRESVGLKRRTPEAFNLFLRESTFIQYAKQRLHLVYCEDFASLHDLILYVLVPMVNQGKVDYDHPLVVAATTLLLRNAEDLGNAFGSFGQNRLYIFHKVSSDEQ